MPQKATPFLERLRLSCSPLTAHRQEASQQAQQSQQASSPSGMSCRGEGRVEGGTRTRRDATQSLFLPSRSFDASDENRLALLSQGLEKLSAGSSPRFGPKAGRVTSRLHDHATATRTETDSTHLLASCLRAACFVRARAAAWGPSLSHLLIVSEGTFPSFVWMDEYKAGLSRTETNAPTAITTVASIALMKSKSWGKPPKETKRHGALTCVAHVGGHGKLDEQGYRRRLCRPAWAARACLVVLDRRSMTCAFTAVLGSHAYPHTYLAYQYHPFARRPFFRAAPAPDPRCICPINHVNDPPKRASLRRESMRMTLR